MEWMCTLLWAAVECLSVLDTPPVHAVHTKKQEAVLNATAVRSPLPVMLLILPCPPCLLHGGSGKGRGVWQGEGRGRGGEGGGGRGHFIHLAIYCTTTWCFALKGLRTTINCFLTTDLDPEL